MSQKRLKTWQKATALVPLALLSGAWTTSLALTSSATAATEDVPTLPDGTAVPTQAIEAPASLSTPGELAPGVPAGTAEAVISSASTNGIPAAALAAYQRAAQVINSADASCNISWQLIAAIGRVESDHGRYGGNTLGDDGKSTPGIYGIPLDGSNGTARIDDTDAGQYDTDQVFDRAVGPMQFIPSTWTVVGVDADGDGVRDPQDIDDAALASAVYLCSGGEDLSTTPGQRAAVYRYNHSQEYVDLVLAIMTAYLQGDYSSVPNGTATATVFAPADGDTVFARPVSGKQPGDAKDGRTGDDRTDGPRSSGDPARGGDEQTGGDEVPDDGPQVDGPGDGGGDDPVTTVTDSVDETVKDGTETVTETVTALDKARATCQSNFSAAELTALGGLESCARQVVDSGLASVQARLGDLLGDGPVDDITDGVGDLLD